MLIFGSGAPTLPQPDSRRYCCTDRYDNARPPAFFDPLADGLIAPAGEMLHLVFRDKQTCLAAILIMQIYPRTTESHHIPHVMHPQPPIKRSIVIHEPRRTSAMPPTR